ncbi:GAF domain-containing protein [Synechocystis sp. LKSZ1]|uniref:GAF domain-containing protein n=1 Tax=Synechocystis sp. LKSZ1 TaxID=3144951 RepID=UPI00336BF0DC
MSIDSQSPDELLQSIHHHRQELETLRAETAMLTVHNQILKNFVSLASTSAGWLIVKATLQKTLEAAIKQTQAAQGSLFLLDSQGHVTESILARGATTRVQREEILGQVLDKGLAGWVKENRQTGLVTDTLKDFRWLKLPDEPYEVRSALGIPIFWGGVLLGVMTLMHPLPGQFNEGIAHGMEKTAELIALVLNTAKVYTERKQVEDELRTRDELFGQLILNFPGILWVLDNQGNFLVCGGLAFPNLGVSLEESLGRSVFDLYAIAPNLLTAINEALTGQGVEAVNFKLHGLNYQGWCSPICDGQGRVLRILCILHPLPSLPKTVV